MSIIQKIRDKYAPLVIGLIAVSLVAFILMDAFVGRSSGLFSKSNDIGSVNGRTISMPEFQAKLKAAEDMYKARGMDLSNPMMMKQLRDATWERIVQEELLNAEYEKLGITVTDKEVADVLFGNNPPDEFKQFFTDPNTGAYDPNMARQRYNQIRAMKEESREKQILNDYLREFIANAKRQKYFALFSGSAFVPDWMIEKDVAEKNAIASISYVGVPYANISDSAKEVQVSDADIQDYINKHKEDFKQEASRSIAYVSFDASASALDSANVFKQIAEMRTAFAQAPDAKVFVTRNQSAQEYFDGYVQKSKMSFPGADSVKALAPGQIYGPYLDGNTYKLARMLDVRDVPDSVKCRHILISNQSRPDSLGKKLADSIATAIQGGADFNEMVLKYSDDGGSKNNKGEYDFSCSTALLPEFYNVVILGKAGDKKVIKTDAGYHYVEVISQKNIASGVKVAYMGKKIEPSDETNNNANSMAVQFRSEATNAKTFEDALRKKNYNKLVASDIKESDIQITGIGENRELIRWTFDGKVGDVSEVTEVDEKYVVALITESFSEGTMGVKKARPLVEPLVRNQKKAKEIIKKIGTANTLEAVAAATGQSVLRADSVNFAASFIPQIGQEIRVIGASFNKDLQGKVSAPIEGGAGVFVIRVESIGSKPTDPNVTAASKNALEMNMKRSAGFATVDALKKVAKVKDERAKRF